MEAIAELREELGCAESVLGNAIRLRNGELINDLPLSANTRMAMPGATWPSCCMPSDGEERLMWHVARQSNSANDWCKTFSLVVTARARWQSASRISPICTTGQTAES